MSRDYDPVWRRWEEVDRILDRLLEVEAPDRSRHLIALCQGDEELERVLVELLAATESAQQLCLAPGPRLLVAALRELPSSKLRVDGGIQNVGPYRIIEEIGRGGMGSVYLAERDDPDFPQRVALKLLRRGIDTEDVLARFLVERQILASLQHPGIATVFDAGSTADGRPYLVMEHVRGRSITSHCDSHGLDVRARLRVFMAVVRAVAHAHEHGVIHRDLKPSNILVTEDEGHVKLLDFGIAKILDPVETTAGRAATGPGTRILTPGFASPEQVLGFPITERSDVYQLGLLLCELLTGRRPFDRLSAQQYERTVGTTDPQAPSRLVRSGAGPRATAGVPPARPLPSRSSDPRGLARLLAGDLDAIVLRALQRDPLDRYASARALHDDVILYLDGLPVEARRGAALYRLRKRVGRRIRQGAAPVLAVTTAGAVLFVLADRPRAGTAGAEPVRWVATAGVLDETDSTASHLAVQVSELLATNLARLPALQVVRLHHLIPPGAVGIAALGGARQAGAEELLQGSIRNPAPGELELVLRRISARTGLVVDSVRSRGADGFELVDRATALLLVQLGLPDRAPRVAGITTADAEAYRLYIEGLTAFRIGDDRVADRFFRAALAQDTGFAMAAYYAFRAAAGSDRDAALQFLNQANRLAPGASDRDRLVIQARWAEYMHDHATPTLADSLTVRYPADPDGHYLRGRTLFLAGDFLGAVPHFERAVRLDSLSLHTERALCVACDALLGLETTYERADSLAAAVRVARRWTALQPGSAHAWHTLASDLMHQTRYEEAIAARTRAASLRVGNSEDPLFPGIVAIHKGDFAEADALFRQQARNGTRLARRGAYWWLAISLRLQGRLDEALQSADEFLEASRPPVDNAWWDVPGRSLRAQILFEMGRFREAAEHFEAAPRRYAEYSRSRQARHDAWLLTHAGTARAAAGDTSALATLADAVEVIGARSFYGRDQLLHHYLRALLARARRTSEDNVEQHLRSALFSLPNGYTRINIELGMSLLRQDRAPEAIPILAAALRNSSESNGLYTTRTEFHEQLGLAWEAAGRADSAAVHYRAVLDAWRQADPVFRPRVREIQRRLAALATR